MMSVGRINVFAPEALLAQAPAAAPVPEPLGEPVARVRSVAAPSAAGASRHGVWECSPGVWRRQIVQAEFCHFLEGTAIFRPDGGEPVRISAGETAFFPAGSLGVWEILTPCRKVFVVFAEAQAA